MYKYIIFSELCPDIIREAKGIGTGTGGKGIGTGRRGQGYWGHSDGRLP